MIHPPSSRPSPFIRAQRWASALWFTCLALLLGAVGLAHGAGHSEGFTKAGAANAAAAGWRPSNLLDAESPRLRETSFNTDRGHRSYSQHSRYPYTRGEVTLGLGIAAVVLVLLIWHHRRWPSIGPTGVFAGLLLVLAGIGGMGMAAIGLIWGSNAALPLLSLGFFVAAGVTTVGIVLAARHWHRVPWKKVTPSLLWLLVLATLYFLAWWND